jgi:hypothetical protein
MWIDWVTEPWTAIFLHPQDRCGDKLITIGRRGRTCESNRRIPATLDRGARLENARERDRYSAPERHVIVRSTTAARPSMRRD